MTSQPSATALAIDALRQRTRLWFMTHWSDAVFQGVLLDVDYPLVGLLKTWMFSQVAAARDVNLETEAYRTELESQLAYPPLYVLPKLVERTAVNPRLYHVLREGTGRLEGQLYLSPSKVILTRKLDLSAKARWTWLGATGGVMGNALVGAPEPEPEAE